MKTIKNYNQFNESKFNVSAYLKPKTDEELEQAYMDQYPNELLIQASKVGDIKGFQYAMDHGADLSAFNDAIIWVSRYGYLEICKLLLQNPRLDPSILNNYAIQLASTNGHLDVVKLLLQDPRVDPSDSNNYAIEYASELEHLEVLKVLLQDQRVVDKLSPNDLQKYQQQIKK